jgi:catechol 2,3-dioxygenase-like lactoylglutathione lyase family enzyme
MASLIDHVFLRVKDVSRALAFYDKVLAPMGITRSIHFEPRNAPAGHPVEHGYDKDHRHFFWILEGNVDSRGVHIGFAAKNKEEVDACYKAAIEAGAQPNDVFGGAPSTREFYSPGYYAATVYDLEGATIEFTYKAWQHPAPGTE